MKKAILIAGLVLAGVALAADPDVVSREAWRVQVDTNTVTTTTLYTASKAGALLAGKINGTNAVGVAVEAGTNAWVKIAQGQ
jgi:predicted NAD/FAD-dependent oxidoreductase